MTLRFLSPKNRAISSFQPKPWPISFRRSFCFGSTSSVSAFFFLFLFSFKDEKFSSLKEKRKRKKKAETEDVLPKQKLRRKEIGQGFGWKEEMALFFGERNRRVI